MKINKILLYGQGNGRDHINHLEMKKCKNLEYISLIKNENALMEKDGNVLRIANIKDAVEYAKKYKPDLIMVSNRGDLSEGAVDIFRKEGFNTFGITKELAKLETSKAYSKDFMKRNNISTPDYFLAKDETEAIKFIEKNWDKTQNGYVLKVEQFSKNSFARTAVPETVGEAISEIHRLFDLTPNAQLIIEEKIKGYELSLHILINNGKYTILPLVQDYKRKYPKDEGPMTAGTVSVAETKAVPDELICRLKKEVIEPTILGFKRENINYNYVLYIGVMITESGKPYILEYNTRTGNPEWLAILGLLDKPFIELIESYYNDISKISNFWRQDYYSIAMYGFSSGYPECERIYFNEKIKNLEKLRQDTEIIGEHIVKKGLDFVPSGGRVFALRRIGKNFEETKTKLLDEFYKIKMNGLYFREDIKPINFK